MPPLIRTFGTFVLRHPLKGSQSIQNPWHAMPGTLDTFLAMHMAGGGAPDACLAEPPRQRPMWAVRDKNVVLFEVDPDHVERLDHHWNAYSLDRRIGQSKDVLWGPLDQLDDYRA